MTYANKTKRTMNHKNSKLKGLISNIQKYSIQDGPGIRTTVFFKGCPLKCRWCSNPECWNKYPEIMFEQGLCVQCKTCMEICPQKAISFDETDKKPSIDFKKCDLCMKCVENCPSGALKIVGEFMSVKDVMAEILSDQLFYRNSKGGATLSGGEVLFHSDFALEILKQCKNEHLHTTIDTSGYADWSVWEKLINYVDLVLLDIKHLDSKIHKEWTGVDNTKILENAPKIAKLTKMWVRVPIIPGFNDTRDNIIETARFAFQIGAEKLTLLGYHELGRIKFDGLDRDYSLKGLSPLKGKRLEELKNFIEADKIGINVTIGY